MRSETQPYSNEFYQGLRHRLTAKALGSRLELYKPIKILAVRLLSDLKISPSARVFKS